MGLAPIGAFFSPPLRLQPGRKRIRQARRTKKGIRRPLFMTTPHIDDFSPRTVPGPLRLIADSKLSMTVMMVMFYPMLRSFTKNQLAEIVKIHAPASSLPP
jgi:hypothetical protein